MTTARGVHNDGVSPVNPAPVKIALVNDHPLVLEGLRALLKPYEDLEVVELDAKVPVGTPVDLVLIDMHGQTRPLGDEVRDRLAQTSNSRVVVYSWHAGAELVETCQQAGAWGVLSKTLAADELAAALRRISAGERVVATGTPQSNEDLDATQGDRQHTWPGRAEGLSMRQAEMITLICQGLSNEQICERLYLSPNSVKTYIRTAYQKIGATSRSQAVIWGLEHGMRPATERRLT